MPAPSDLVHVTTTSTGTGNLTVSAVNGKRTFNTAFGTGGTNVFDYFISSRDAAEWERGTGSLSASTTLVRDTVIASSNANAAVNFSAGVKDISNDVPAASQYYAGGTDVAVADGGTGASTASQARANLGLSGRNRIINGTFTIDQRNSGGSTSVADNVYWADRWRYLGEASASLTARSTGMGRNPHNAVVTLTGTTDKGGIFQVIEGANCKDMRSQAVVLSAYISVSNVRIGNIKIGIIEFTGTEDATTGDPISAWGADGVTPTLAASWAFLNTPANLSVTTGVVKYSVTATVGASANNLAVMIWNDDKSYTANDAFQVAEVQLELGSVASEFERIPVSRQLIDCQRYYYRTIEAGIHPRLYGYSSTSSTPQTTWPHPVTMRAAPSLNIVGTWDVSNCTGPTSLGTDIYGFGLYCTVTSTGAYACSPGTGDYITMSIEI